MFRNVLTTFAEAHAAAASNIVLAAGGSAIIVLRPIPEKKLP
jgi:hypothetical protein